MSGTTPGSWAERDAAVVWHRFTQMAAYVDNAPLVIARAKGRELIDADGRRYLDRISSLWVNTMGQRVPELDAALAAPVLDEAHAVLGPHLPAAGRDEAGAGGGDQGAHRGTVVRVGTLSKTLGSLGGFLPMAPPMAAAALGRPSFAMADLVRELRWPDGPVTVGLVETAGGVRSPLADDGDCLALCGALEPDLVVLVADAGLGTINAVRLTVEALGDVRAPVVVVLNRFDAAEPLHIQNAEWLRSRVRLTVVEFPGGEMQLAGLTPTVHARDKSSAAGCQGGPVAAAPAAVPELRRRCPFAGTRSADRPAVGADLGAAPGTAEGRRRVRPGRGVARRRLRVNGGVGDRAVRGQHVDGEAMGALCGQPRVAARSGRGTGVGRIVAGPGGALGGGGIRGD